MIFSDFFFYYYDLYYEFVVGSLLCSERFFSGYSGFPLSSKPTLPNSNSICNARTRLNELISTPIRFVGKQAIYDFFFSTWTVVISIYVAFEDCDVLDEAYTFELF